MTKQKKVIWIILGIIIFVFSVFLGLGYLGQITGGNSLIQRTEMNDKYVPEEITKYYPIEDLNSKESLLSDENYANSIQDALLSASIEFEQGEEYKAHIDKIIKEFENENYKSVLYISEKNDIESSLTFSKFKIKEVDGKKRYAHITSVHEVIKKDRPYDKDTMSLLKSQLALSDSLQDLNISPDNSRFLYGFVHDEDIYNTKIENKKPDEIIYFELCEKPFYFWYYENFQSDKSGKSLSIEIER